MKFELNKKAGFLLKEILRHLPFGNQETIDQINFKNCQLILSSSNMRMCM